MIQEGNKVKLHYIGKLENGTVFDSSVERDVPLEVTIGQKKLISGFENGIIGMSVGEKKDIKISPEEGYGLVREDMILTIPKSNVPDGVEVGGQLQTTDKNGNLIAFIVREVRDNEVVVDANHPLAGKVMNFSVEILEIL